MKSPNNNHKCLTRIECAIVEKKAATPKITAKQNKKKNINARNNNKSAKVTEIQMRIVWRFLRTIIAPYCDSIEYFAFSHKCSH